MAEGFLKSFDASLKVYSAGTEPANKVHPKAIAVMQETGIDLSDNYPKNVSRFLNKEFDYVITVCGGPQKPPEPRKKLIVSLEGYAMK